MLRRATPASAVDLQKVEARRLARLVELHAAERRERQTEALESIFPIHQARGHGGAQAARVLVAVARLVAAETAVEAVLARAADQPVVARLAAQPVIARLAEENVVAVTAGDVVAVVEAPAVAVVVIVVMASLRGEPVVGGIGKLGEALDALVGVVLDRAEVLGTDAIAAHHAVSD